MVSATIRSASSSRKKGVRFKPLPLDSEWMIDLAVEGVRSIRGGKNIPRFSQKGEKTKGQKFRTERVRYAHAENAFRRQLQADFAKLESFDMPLKEFYSRFSERIYKHQVKMYLLGRRAAGRQDTKLSEADRRMLHGAHSRQMKYFNGFIRDWAGKTGRMRKDHRLDMYGTSGYSIYLRGAVAGLPGGGVMRWHWIVNEEAEHCDDCIKRAEKSRKQGGFTVQELEEMGYPGEKTICKTRCRCHLDPVPVRLRLPRTRPTSFKDIHHGKKTKAESGSEEENGSEPQTEERRDTGSRRAQKVRGKRERTRRRNQ